MGRSGCWNGRGTDSYEDTVIREAREKLDVTTTDLKLGPKQFISEQLAILCSGIQ